MTGHHTPNAPKSIGNELLGLVTRIGSPEERRLVAAHASELIAFLDHPDTRHFIQRRSLDIGLENRLVLKFNLMASTHVSPLGLINEWAERMPVLQPAAEIVFRHKLRCHAGIKLSPAGVSYELYPYETSGHLLARTLLAGHAPDESGLPAKPHCFGFASTGEISAYAELHDVDIAELEQALGFTLPAEGLKANALFNSRLNPNGSWRTDKAGIEFLPFPSYLLNRVIASFNLRFSYLLHRGGTRRYGVIGVHGPRQVLYTTLLPRITKPR